ncbi:CCA-adding enzyme [bioreactor metagenome]|uniref:CCA-adding enzyme n=1 Tax=bioreactor metagenome TaxID=1076179 RepID=A0A645AKU2_9ZZZZ
MYTKFIDKIIRLPEEVKFIINNLESKGFEAFAVGGCIRDILIEKTPTDWDITTNAKPDEVKFLFEELGYKVIETGIKHGTVAILVNKNQYEVTTYRIEKEYLDNRHPSEVFFTNVLKEDLLRRDFTINAMAYNENKGLIDYFQGLTHLEERRIKTVGDAEDRFREDSLRILRAIRFSTTLKYSIDKDVEEGIRHTCKLLLNISKERVRDEFIKVLLSDTPSYGIKKLCDLGAMEFIIPQLSKISVLSSEGISKEAAYKSLEILDQSEASLTLRLSVLIYIILYFSSYDPNLGKYVEYNTNVADLMVKHILQTLKFDNVTISRVALLLGNCHIDFKMDSIVSVKSFISRVGIDNFEEMVSLIFTTLKIGTWNRVSYDEMIELENHYYEIIEGKEPIYIKDLLVNGNDLISLGIPKGKILGDILKYLLTQVMENKYNNTKEILIELAKKYCNFIGFPL